MSEPKPRYLAMYLRCEGCGGWKAKHAHRCKACSELIRGENHYAWKGDAAGTMTKRERAQKRYALGVCERCRNKKATDRHHVDGDTGNNEPENILCLCRRCHMEVDGRLERLIQRNRNPRVRAEDVQATASEEV